MWVGAGRRGAAWVETTHRVVSTADTGHPDHLIVTDVLGAAVWGLGLFFEAAGDWQLARFKSDPANKGKVMRYGLWRYTRHPNYFGDATLWWGYFIIAAGTTDGWVTVFGPVIMTVLVMRVSGVALLERSLKQEKPEYADYMARTSAFVPCLPRGSLCWGGRSQAEPSCGREQESGGR